MGGKREMECNSNPACEDMGLGWAWEEGRKNEREAWYIRREGCWPS